MKKVLIFILALMNLPLCAAVSLNQVNQFGPNPGNLKMFHYIPRNAPRNAPLVVLLHGCAQAATDFDDETGWTNVADRLGLHLLLPEQKESNNDWRCFNWFQARDNSRGQGEALSIISMIKKVAGPYSINPKRIYIAGLSAGAAMASAMLANYPEVFKGGALVAGIPYGCASNSINAWSCMSGTSFPPIKIKDYARVIKKASSHHNGPLPRVMIVHGTSDQFVSYKNALISVGQWSLAHGVDELHDDEFQISGQSLKVYKKGQNPVVAFLSIKFKKHGYPINSRLGCGSPGKFILDGDICASYRIAQFWGLAR